MAIYHMEAKVISRGAGRSAVAAAAYMSCSEIYNDYDGVQHDYTRKGGLVWQSVFLPEYAPPEWKDRGVLWNAVEENETTKDSRLAREFVVALPMELDRERWQALLTEFVQSQFVADGMCADVAVHDTDGHNPHAHIMLTVRPLDEQGKWQYKTEKEYLCVRNGEERGFTAAEFKAAQAEGWEKQYSYKVGKKKVYLPPSEAEKHGYERGNKYPKSTKCGRQNPISQRWNSEEQLALWRAAWAEISNRYLEQAGHDARIDHRSHTERGLDEQPTIHEGVVARALEAKGIISDRCELNRQIRADNSLLRELKTQVQKLTETVKGGVAFLAEAFENLRKNMIIFRYQLLHIKDGKEQIGKTLDAVRPDLERYTEIVRQIKLKVRERKELLAEKKATPPLQVLRHRELAQKIATLTEDLEELRSEKAVLLTSFECIDDDAMEAVKGRVTEMETTLQTLDQQDEKYSTELSVALTEYASLEKQAEEVDRTELAAERQAIRPDSELEVAQQLQSAYGKRYDGQRLEQSRADVAAILGEERRRPSIHQQLLPKHETRMYRQRHQEQER